MPANTGSLESEESDNRSKVGRKKSEKYGTGFEPVTSRGGLGFESLFTFMYNRIYISLGPLL